MRRTCQRGITTATTTPTAATNTPSAEAANHRCLTHAHACPGWSTSQPTQPTAIATASSPTSPTSPTASSSTAARRRSQPDQRRLRCTRTMGVSSHTAHRDTLAATNPARDHAVEPKAIVQQARKRQLRPHALTRTSLLHKRSVPRGGDATKFDSIFGWR